MKNLKFLAYLLSAFVMLFLASCDKDDPVPDDPTPVIDEDFAFTVSDNDVTFTTTLPGTVWFINCTNGAELTVADGVATTSISTMGTYPFTCNTLVSGETYASDTFNVVIAVTDLSFLDGGIWNALTGGRDNGKVWILDLEKKYFHCIADYYGDAEAGALDKEAWGPWGGGYVSDYDLGGEISFNGATNTVTLTYNGETKSGIFSFAPFERPISDDYVDNYVETDVFDLWAEGFTNDGAPYSYLPLSDSMGTMSLPEGFYFPLDSARFYNDAAAGKNTVNSSQFLPEDLQTCDIVHVSDSSMVVRVKRSYEADGENLCWMLYNFIVKGHEYAFIPPSKPATSGTIEDGTYKLAEFPGFYYSWSTLALIDTWDNIDTYKMNMAEWWSLGNPSETMLDGALTAEGQARWDAAYGAYTSQTIVVSGNNVTVNYKGINVWGDTPTALIESTVATTYTASGGVITFADSISVYTPNAPFDKVVELYIIPDVFSTGIAIGVDDVDEADKKYQSKLQNWIKQ